MFSAGAEWMTKPASRKMDQTPAKLHHDRMLPPEGTRLGGESFLLAPIPPIERTDVTLQYLRILVRFVRLF